MFHRIISSCPVLKDITVNANPKKVKPKNRNSVFLMCPNGNSSVGLENL